MEKDNMVTVTPEERKLIELVRSIVSGELRVTVEDGKLMKIVQDKDWLRCDTGLPKRGRLLSIHEAIPPQMIL